MNCCLLALLARKLTFYHGELYVVAEDITLTPACLLAHFWCTVYSVHGTPEARYSMFYM